MAISKLQLPTGLLAHSLGDAAKLAETLALDVAERLRSAVTERGVATLVVSGGKSPVAFFQHLAKQELPWNRVVVSIADERWVPVAHADSNEGLVKRYLLTGAAVAAKFIGLYSPAATVDQAARDADLALAELPPIDVLILGMGDDGHTASLFPKSPHLDAALQTEGSRRCLPMLAPTVPHQRLTMTWALLSKARLPILSIQGQAKLDTLTAALQPGPVQDMPIRAFLGASLQIYWCP